MNELIKIEEKNGQQLVSARELHEKLKLQKDFSDWIKSQLESVGAIENIDYVRFPFKKEGNNATLIEYALSIDIAKEICMVVGISPRTNEETKILSKKIRKYFIDCEKQLKENRNNFSLIDDRLGVLQQLVNQCDTSQARDRIRIKMADLICKTRKTAATAYKDTETVLESIDLEEYVSNKDFEYVKIKDAYNDYCKIDNDPVGRTTFCRCVYDHGYTRKQIKDKEQKTQYVFSKIGGR